MNSKRTALVWFRNDLRLSDNPALTAAIKTGASIVPVFIWAPEEEGNWPPGAASQWWLHHSLNKLGAALQSLGSRLIVRQGPSLLCLQKLIRETQAKSVFWNTRYEPYAIARDTKIIKKLQAEGIKTDNFNGSLLFDPSLVRTMEGRPYQVFTPFWRSCISRPPPRAPLPFPKTLSAPNKWPASLTLDDLGLLPKIHWDKGWMERWQPGEKGAQKTLKKFLRINENYAVARNIPSQLGTSRLSPHLHFGEISPHQIWNQINKTSDFLRELGWREFAHHLMFHFPDTPNKPLRKKFEKFPWRSNKELLKAWQYGTTGFPLIDAGMRELWQTGWMHNRVRMIVASFLVKDLRISWTEGARWFWDTLVDADLANNTLGWQWSAGCGADAAPYFRIFNPMSQTKKFDPNHAYIQQWVPEYGTARYPKPIVDHAQSRVEALRIFRTLP
ncbi:MAG: Deoxyribodipyrimidine photo-lyase [Elusimicrobia bacterium]|nr:Deoxyribodipyrimidine photo-lyase [Elusimicrobiota bacterium]